MYYIENVYRYIYVYANIFAYIPTSFYINYDVDNMSRVRSSYLHMNAREIIESYTVGVMN